MKKTELKQEKRTNLVITQINKELKELTPSILSFDELNPLNNSNITEKFTNITELMIEGIKSNYREAFYYELSLLGYDDDYDYILDLLVLDFINRKVYGKTTKERIVNHIVQFSKDIEETKQYCKALKLSKKETEDILKSIIGENGTSGLSHNLTRIQRTEDNAAINEATIEAYKKAGIKHYQYIATLDNRTCSPCQDLHKKIFPVSKAKRGVNLPSMHPNCRCYIKYID